MKKIFPGYFPKEDSDHKALWGKCLFVFDANILLNLYRYSDDARSGFLQVLDRLKDRAWIPHRVAEEYLTNRLKVIFEQQEEYTVAISEIAALNKKLENPRQHPFVSRKIMDGVADSLNNLISELESNKEIHSKRMSDDEIKERLAIIFDGRVGDELKDEELEELIKEGGRRYAEKIPPGYSDAKKTSGEEFLRARCRPCGDLIVWKQLLYKAKAENTSVIFVTDDGKEDWWLRFKGKTIGARPELVKEFISNVGMDFHMYHPERFLSLAGDFLKQETSPEILNEIREFRAKEQASEIMAVAEFNKDSAGKHYERLIDLQASMVREYEYFIAKSEALKESLGIHRAAKDRSIKTVDDFKRNYPGVSFEDSKSYQGWKDFHDGCETRIIAQQEELNAVNKVTDDLRSRLVSNEARIKATYRHLYGKDEITMDDLRF